MQLALAGAVGAAGDHHEPDDRHGVGDRGHEPGGDLAQPVDLVDDLRDPERDAVDVDDHAEVQEAEREHAPVLEHLADRVPLVREPHLLLALEALGQPALLVVGEPLRVLRPVVEEEQHEDGREDRGDRLDQEQPLPVLEAGDTVEDRHDAARDRRADGVGDRDRRHEEADGARPLTGREPVRQVQDHAGEEAGLRDAEQEADDVEAQRPLHEHRAGRDDPPRDHDARDPLARAEAVQREVAGHLEDEVGEEEDAGAEAVDRSGEAEVGLQLVLGEGDVHPVEVGDDVEAQQDGHESRRDPAHRPCLQFGWLGVCLHGPTDPPRVCL